MIIYYAKNIINNKYYIGQTRYKFERRKSRHINTALKGSKYYFHRALIKHGIENFEWGIIFETDDLTILNEKEKYYIEFYNSFCPNGYNLTSGGGNGYIVSEETKQKIRKAFLGEKNPWYGKHLSEERKQKLREANLGKNHPMYGKHHSEETKQKIKNGNIGKNLGKHPSEETKQKIKEKALERYRKNQ